MKVSESAGRDAGMVESSGPRLRVVPPTPPTSKSRDADGHLKDTPANRALHPTVTPQSIFASQSLVKELITLTTRAWCFMAMLAPYSDSSMMPVSMWIA